MKTFYDATKAGLDRLFTENQSLAETARTIVMWYLKDEFGKSKERMEIALKEAIEWIGLSEKTPSLFEKFKKDLETIGYNDKDDHGLADETVKVANLMIKYKALKDKEKKNIMFG